METPWEAFWYGDGIEKKAANWNLAGFAELTIDN